MSPRPDPRQPAPTPDVPTPSFRVLAFGKPRNDVEEGRARIEPDEASRTLRAFAADESGAAILEFAVALPILVTLFFGCFELGRALLIRQAMEGAVRGGARYLARVPDPTCRPACSSGADHAVRMTTDRIVENTGLRPDAVSVAPFPAPPPGTVAMQASVAFEVAFLTSLGKSWTLTARHQEQRVGE